MLKLNIPQTGENTKTAKDLIITILTQEQHLTIMELYNRIRRQYNISITYQAVRKAVELMLEETILTKSQRKYTINKDWLLKLKSFIDKTLATYETTTKVYNFTQEYAKEDYAVYTLGNLLDLDNFWAEIMYHWVDSKPKNKTAVCVGHYAWWNLINLGSETKLYSHFNKKKIKTTFLFTQDTPLNHYAAKIYKAVGVKLYIKNCKVDETTGVNILGDLVIQVKYPQALAKKIKTFFEKNKDISSISMQSLTALMHEQHDIKFIVLNDKDIADSLRKKYLNIAKEN